MSSSLFNRELWWKELSLDCSASKVYSCQTLLWWWFWKSDESLSLKNEAGWGEVVGFKISLICIWLWPLRIWCKFFRMIILRRIQWVLMKGVCLTMNPLPKPYLSEQWTGNWWEGRIMIRRGVDGSYWLPSSNFQSKSKSGGNSGLYALYIGGLIKGTRITHARFHTKTKIFTIGYCTTIFLKE